MPSGVRMKLLPMSKISCSRRVLLERPSCRMGTLRRVVLQDIGRKHPRRHLPERGLHRGRHLRHRHIDLDVRMKVDPDHRVAVVRLRFDVLDVVDVRK